MTPYAVEHNVPTLGYVLEDQNSGIFFSGDTAETTAIQQVMDQHPKLNHLVIETTFDQSFDQLAALSKHFSPHSLVRCLDKMAIAENRAAPQLWLTHLKPPLADRILAEITQWADLAPNVARFRPRPLQQGMTLFTENFS